MPSKKKKYNARFPAGRIKKIMQTDEEVGKVAQAVPIIISRTLELFVESLLTKTMHITESRAAKTLTPSHLKQCILSESRFDFLKDLVRNVPDAGTQEEIDNNANDNANANGSADDTFSNPMPAPAATRTTRSQTSSSSAPSSSSSSSACAHTPVIQYQPRLEPTTSSTPNNSNSGDEQPKIHIEIGRAVVSDAAPRNSFTAHSSGGQLYIDEDYDD